MNSEPNPYAVGDEADVVTPITSQIVAFEFTATDPRKSEWKVRGYDDRVQFIRGYQTHELMRDMPKLHSRFFDQPGLERILIVDMPEPLGLKFTEEDFLELRRWAGAVRQSELDQEIDGHWIFHILRLAGCGWVCWWDVQAFEDFSVAMCLVLMLLVFADAVIGRLWHPPWVFRLYSLWFGVMAIESLRRLVMNGLDFWALLLVGFGMFGVFIHLHHYRLYKDVVPDDQLREA